jgi:CRP/FNR family transcriptional regulator, dissimilatory nitrate respiration regulator
MPLIGRRDSEDQGSSGRSYSSERSYSSAIPPALLALGMRKQVSSGTILFQQGGQAESCYYLESGEFALRRSSRSGDEVEIARIGAGDWFGEIILFASSAYPAEAIAIQDSEVLVFRRSEVLSSGEGEVHAFFLGLLARKCLALNRRIEELTVMDARERLARYIIDLCPGRRKGCEGGASPCSFPLPKKKREIAAVLGMAPETLSRTLRQMEEEGYFKMSGSRIEVPSCSFLTSLIGD